MGAGRGIGGAAAAVLACSAIPFDGCRCFAGLLLVIKQLA